VKRRCSGIRCSIRSRIGGSATGVLITDNCHDTVRRWEQCAPGTSAAPEQKVNRKAGGRGRPTPDLAALTFTAGPTDWIEPGGYARLPPLRIFTRGDFRFCFSVNGHCAPGSLPLSCCPADDLPRRPAPAQRLGMCRQAIRAVRAALGNPRLLRLRLRSDLIATPYPCCAFANVSSGSSEADLAWTSGAKADIGRDSDFG